MHGILNLNVSMKRIERALRRRGYKVVNLDYPSRSKTIEEHAGWLAERVAAEGEGDLYFVGHSLGSIVIRYYLAERRPERAVRFVMIAPPNHGSAAADIIDGKTPFYSLIWGEKAGAQLRAKEGAFWQSLPPPPVEFGILAGGRGDGEGLNPLIPGDDDGTVAVDEARLEGAKDFLLLPYQHTTIILKKKAVEGTVRFLETGSFH